MSRRIINFLDTETTGLNEAEHRIVEYCGMLYDLDTEEHLKTWVWRLNPQRPITPKAAKVHGIRAEDVQHCQTLEQLAPTLQGAINPHYAHVAHNGDDFDFPFLRREMLRVGHPIHFTRTYDTMKQGRWATATGKIPRLGELAAALDVPYDPAQAHAAEYDVSVMAQCFFEGRRLGFFNIA